jgi:nucleoside-diphosphate-sugar epimerase
MTSEKTNSNSKTVLVVGATGNTGLPLVKQILARGYDLRVIVRSSDKFPQELLENSNKF